MKLIAVYLLTFLLILSYLTLRVLTGNIPPSLEPLKIGLLCTLIGGVGGCVYCLRGIYISACARSDWSDTWQPWYYIRPFVSLVCGGISYLLIRSGLILLESGPNPQSSALGFYVLAFIAGLNVDKFVSKIEDVAQTAFGIEKSRTAKEG